MAWKSYKGNKAVEEPDKTYFNYARKPILVNATQFLSFENPGELQLEYPNVWFMFDNHSFRRINITTPEEIFNQIRHLFNQDGCGSVFVKFNGVTVREFDLQANYKLNGYKILDEEINNWITKFFSIKPLYYILTNPKDPKSKLYVKLTDWVVKHQDGSIEVIKHDDFHKAYQLR